MEFGQHHQLMSCQNTAWYLVCRQYTQCYTPTAVELEETPVPAEPLQLGQYQGAEHIQPASENIPEDFSIYFNYFVLLLYWGLNSCILGKWSTTELHPQLILKFILSQGLTKLPRLVWNLLTSYLTLKVPGIRGLHHHSRLSLIPLLVCFPEYLTCYTNLLLRNDPAASCCRYVLAKNS